MKRSQPTRRAKLSPDTEQLLRFASGLAHSGSRVEDGFWEARLSALIDRLLADDDEGALSGALEHLYGNRERAYDGLADLIEDRSESQRRKVGSNELDLLLFVAPLLAWSRFSIPTGSINADILANARVQLQAHVFARDARLGLADFLYSPDQLPQSYCATAVLTAKLAKAALQERDLHLDPQQLPETTNFLSDTRYLVGVVAVVRGAPMFRWQEDDGSRDLALHDWRSQGSEALRPLLHGCASELLLPQAYHAGCREADRQSRPYSLRASVAYLGTTLNLAPSDLRIVVAPYFDRQLEEYRVSFLTGSVGNVAHGVVWPLLDGEDEESDLASEIETQLRDIGVGEITVLDHRLPLEYCDDCGTPLYPNLEGESVHAELPEDQANAAPRHLH
jgi:hypothetical protein